MKVIVVGGGTAGLAAVHTLRKQGADVTCLEAASSAGGRIFSRHKNGYIFDCGAQFFFKYYHTYFQLCAELGLIDDLVSVPFKAAIPNLKDHRLTVAHASINPKDLWNGRSDLLKFRGVPFKAMAQLIPLLPIMALRYKDFDFTDFERMLDLDDESLADFTVRHCGRDVLEHVLQPVASCMTLGEPEEIGAGYGLALLWYSVNGLWTLRHGIGSVSAKLSEKYADCIKLNTAVKRIVIENGKVKGVETKDGFMEADRVICATTATTALKLMPGLPDTIRKPLGLVRYSACCHAMFALRNRLLPEGWYALALPRKFGSTMAGFTDSYIKSPYYTPTGGGLVNCFTFSRHAFELNAKKDADVIKILIKDLQRWVPTMPDEPYFTEICRFDEAVCTSGPGMLKAVLNMKRNHYQDIKGLYLAGEYLYMPSVEGATLSGMDAARAALR